MLEETRFRAMLLNAAWACSSDETRQTPRRRHPPRRHRLPPLRHFRFSRWTSPRTRCANTGRAVDTEGFDRRHGGTAHAAPAPPGPAPAMPASEAVWFELRDSHRPHRIPRLQRPKHAEADHHRPRRPWRHAGGPCLKPAGTAVAAPAQPDALLRRIRRPGRRPAAASLPAPPTCVIEITDTQKKPGNLFLHIGRRRLRPEVRQVGTPVNARIVDHARRAAIRRPPQRHPPAPRSALRRPASAPTSPRKAASTRRTACAST